MNINVKLFSSLRQYCPDYDPSIGKDVEMPPRASVGDLLDHLDIPIAKVPVVSCEGRILKHDDILKDGSALQIFQPVSGG